MGKFGADGVHGELLGTSYSHTEATCQHASLRNTAEEKKDVRKAQQMKLYHRVSVPSGTRETSQHELVPQAPASHSDVEVVRLVSPPCHRMQVLTVKMVRYQNMLLQDVLDAPSLEVFKASLDRLWATLSSKRCPSL